MKGKEVTVLDKGFVRLDGYMADDLSVVNAARVSFAKRKEVVDLADEGLIKFLMRDRHGTPFEHNAFRFHVKAPIFVAREWFRHRIGSFNEWSGRYSKLEAEFYIPFPENVRGQIGKPGAYVFESLSEDQTDWAIEDITTAYDEAWTHYDKLLADGVAKELARVVLPVGIYTQFYWTINARSLMNFLSLRNNKLALREIREYAKVVEEIVTDLMPITFNAFVEHGRVGP